MKIFHLVGGVLIGTVFFLVAIMGYQAWQSSNTVRLVAKLAENNQARTAWIDGTVDLSLERSVTQVALALDYPAPANFLALISQQRELSDSKMDAAMSSISGFSNLRSRDYFLERSA